MKLPIVSRSPDVMGGAVVFHGTRVPVQTVLDCIEAGESIDDFLEGFPSVSREHVIAFLKEAKGTETTWMDGERKQRIKERLNPEKVAYWYFRLNGFLQIVNFVVHPERRGGQRTDADLLGVRFPHRAERLFDNPNDIMADDEQALALSRDFTDVIIAEVKANQPCTLNGPWTKEEQQNVHRVVAAIGCLPQDRIAEAASDIYRNGIHRSDFGLRIRLVAVGRDRSDELTARYPNVSQLKWPEICEFIWHRFRNYRNQKKNVHQWDAEGLKLKRLADQSGDPRSFIEAALPRIW
jgi:uncharacterized protein (DUF433 family)